MTNSDFSQAYFEKPQSIWFPDFEEAMASGETSYLRYSPPFRGGLELCRYFRREITREELLSRISEEAPNKLLARDRALAEKLRKLCASWQEGGLSPADFDEALFLCFRNRPTQDVFIPAPEGWEKITYLIACLEGKNRCLASSLFGMGWNLYLCGKLTRTEYLKYFFGLGTAEYLIRRVTYGADREELAREYGREISACRGLFCLCVECREGTVSPEDFDRRFLALAEEFCVDGRE